MDKNRLDSKYICTKWVNIISRSTMRHSVVKDIIDYLVKAHASSCRKQQNAISVTNRHVLQINGPRYYSR